jgi:hypothetical protein
VANYYYDDNNNVIKVETFSNSDSLLDTEINEYDKDNHLVKNTYTSIRSTAMTRIYNYSKEGQLIETVVQTPGIPPVTIKHYYDEKGLCTVSKIFHDEEKKVVSRETRYTYTFR